MGRLALVGSLLMASLAATVTRPPVSGEELAMNAIAESYVRLVLAVGRHDPDYVDAYYGPPGLRKEAEAGEKTPLDEIGHRAEAMLAKLSPLAPPAGDTMLRLRHRFLTSQLASLVARIRILGGRKMTFDEESKALYDAVAPARGEEVYARTIGQLESALPGEGPLHRRYEKFREAFLVPPARIDAVFTLAIAACRERTARHVTLPSEETFSIEYVTDKPWSAYNWYQGGSRSLIQVNTSLPVAVDQMVDLACHEGYPGHHVYNTLLEQHLVRGRGWIEYSIYPLFSPQSLIAEGSANYGVRLAFPEEDRMAFERATLYPAAGLDPSRAGEYHRVRSLVRQLDHAVNEAARGYLDGSMDAPAAVSWLTRYALLPRDRAEQRLRFIDRYRSYVINYNLGEDLVRGYVESKAGPDAALAARWRVFADLLSSPRLPGDLR